MITLTKRFQKLVLLVLVVLTVTILISYPSKLEIPNNTSIQDIRQYYQNLLKQYSSPSPLSKGPGHEITLQDAITPIPKSTKKAKDVLKQNVQLFSEVMKKPITEPTGLPISRLEDPGYQKANATFVSLVRNSELRGIMSTISQIEETFNKKYQYPYVFLNDKPFSDRFKKGIAQVTSAPVYFEIVDAASWDRPDFIDPEKEKEGVLYLDNKGVGYSKKISYHNMCRYYSMNFYNHERMKQFRYYWRLEPKTNYFCDLDYDVFKFMQDNQKVYGFVLNLYDSPDSVRSLWPTTQEFLKQNPQYLNKNAALSWILENEQNPDQTEVANGYSTCHFWSNFEIGDMDFYRDEAYTKWVTYLHENGGFYYERWGDAPVHSLGLGLFADKSKIHWFRDIGYEHFPYTNCPDSPKCKKCKAGAFSKFKNLNNQNCQAQWIREMTNDELNIY